MVFYKKPILELDMKFNILPYPEEIKEKEVEEKKSFNYLGIIAFALVLLVALNRIFNVVPTVTYVEVGMVILAIVLEVYNYLTLKKA